MRIYCRDCGNKALITKVTEETLKSAKLHCICLEPRCAHGFISELNFSHTLKPSKIFPAENTLIDKILRLTDDQQKQLFEQLDMLT